MSEVRDLFFSDSRQKGHQANALKTAGPAIEQVTVSDRNPTKTASLLLEIRADRVDLFGDGKHQIDDISFHIMLDLMVSESNKRSISMQDLAKAHKVGLSTMLRYADYLASIGMVEKDKNVENLDQSFLKLTKRGLNLCNTALIKVEQRLANF